MNLEMNATQTLLHKVSKEYKIDYEELINKFSSEKAEKSVDSINPINKLQEQKKISINFFNPKKISNPDKKETIKQPRKRNVNDTIKTYKILYKNEYYLVDDHNNVYTFDIVKPKIIGVKLIDQTIKFY
jgi:hypothetical protein